MSNQETIGIVQSSFTVSLTFTNKPDEATRARLKAAGFQFDKGRWYRNQSDSKLATLEDIGQLTVAR